MRYLIVGNGPAGTTAAEHIRANDPRGGITVVTEERLPFYSRIRLVDYLAGEAAEEELVLKAPRWYEENGIALSLGTRAASLDTARKALSTSSGEPYAYDKLLLATGGRSFVPPIEGAGKKGVFTLKTIEDARALREYSRDAEDVAIIGGGVLGLEIGNALLKAGMKVSVVEFFPRLLPRQ
ncbi:MAG: FAD-dependent oxidoreductase, partial [Nitrospirota bacterium]